MALPVATALIDGLHVKTYEYSALGGGLPITLTGSATNSPTAWEWSIIATDPDLEGGIPEASSVATGTNGDFTNGKATVQNPTITLDVPGGYCFSLRAQNVEGWSDPNLDKNGGYQAIVYVKTLKGVKQPPANQKRYQDDLNQGLQTLEDLIGTAAPGVFLSMMNSTVAALVETDSSTFIDITGISNTFSVETAGVYHLGFMASVGAGSGQDTYAARFRLVFDAGASNEQTLGDDTTKWDITVVKAVASGEPETNRVVFFTTVNLDAGSHTVKVQWKRTDGANNIRLWPDVAQFKISGTLLSGSGAGGVLVDTAELSSSATISTIQPSYQIVSDLSVTVDCLDETVLVLGRGTGNKSGNQVDIFARITVDSAVVTPITPGANYAVNSGSISASYGENMSFAEWVPVTAGSRVIRIEWARNTSGSNWTLAQGYVLQVVRFRGGLVPIKDNGTLVVDKPAAIEFVGDTVAVTNVDGVAKVEFNGVTGNLIDSQIYSYFYDSPTLNAAAGFCIGARIHFRLTGKMLGIKFRTAETTAKTFRGKLWNNTTEVASGTVATSAAGLYEVFFTTPYEITEAMLGGTFYLSIYETSAGTHYSSGSGNPPADGGGRGWSYYDSIPHSYNNGGGDATYPASLASVGRYPVDPIFEISGDPAGYVKPENIPILEYNSASVVNVVSAPGASSTFRVLLSDGVRYVANGPLTVDLTASGLGGIDIGGGPIVSTWYYIYFVPGALEGIANVVASATDPNSGGPTGYSVWRYLGHVYNSSSSNIRPFTQLGGGTIRYREEVDAYSNTAPPTSWTALDLSSVLPATCTTARMLVQLTYTNSGSGGGETLYVRRTGDTNVSRRYVWDIDISRIHGNSLETDIETDLSQSLDHYWVRNETFAGCTYRITEYLDNYLTHNVEARAPSTGGGGGGGFDHEKTFVATVAGQETFDLTDTVASNANTPSTYSIRVFTNGNRHQFNSPPGTREFDVPSATTVRVGGLTIGDNIQVDYGV